VFGGELVGRFPDKVGDLAPGGEPLQHRIVNVDTKGQAVAWAGQVKWRSRISELSECLRSGLSYPQKIAVGSRSISVRRSLMLGDGGSWS
jgi:hypothetical protein